MPPSTGSDAAATGQVVLPCPDLEATLAFFTDQLGFRLDTIMPADQPRTAVISGHGLCLRLQRDDAGWPGRLRVTSDELRQRHGPTVEAPNGTVVELAATEPVLVVPPVAACLELTTSTDRDAGGVGRAAMHYRDLLPRRQGGRFIASHITISDAGPVADYVHHHRIRFQVIYCRRGWVRVVYEDQGEPFVLEAGDCVLQPSGIRHRVLESSAGLEVIEVTSPAEHPTHVDHDLQLPTADLRPERTFDGQTFVRHRAAAAAWAPWRSAGFEARACGIAAGTDGLGEVRLVRATAGGAATAWGHHDAELRFWFITAGLASLRIDERPDVQLGADDAVAVPAGLDHALVACSADFELLEVALPAIP